MCTKNLFPELAVHVGSAEPLSFDALVSNASNVQHQLARRKTTSNRPQSNENQRDESKKSQRKSESMTTFVKTSSKPLKEDGSKNQDRGKTKEHSKKLTLQERKQKKYPFDDDDVQAIFDELIEAKALTLPEPKKPNEVGMTNNPKYCPYHRLLGHTIEDCYVLKDIIEGMINKAEIEVDGGKSKGPFASSNAISMIEDDVVVATISVPYRTIPVHFQMGNEVQVIWAYPDMPRFGLGYPTLYEVVTSPHVINESSNEKDDNLFKWHMVAEGRRARQVIAQTSIPHGIIGHKPNKKKSKKDKKKKKKNKNEKMLESDLEEDYVQPPQFPITLKDFDSSNEDDDDDLFWKEEVVQCCMVFGPKDEGVAEVDGVSLRLSLQLTTP
ncbi:hypothetical protein V2J09_013313 [Rumex salicifolius]